MESLSGLAPVRAAPQSLGEFEEPFSGQPAWISSDDTSRDEWAAGLGILAHRRLERIGEPADRTGREHLQTTRQTPVGYWQVPGWKFFEIAAHPGRESGGMSDLGLRTRRRNFMCGSVRRDVGRPGPLRAAHDHPYPLGRWTVFAFDGDIAARQSGLQIVGRQSQTRREIVGIDDQRPSSQAMEPAGTGRAKTGLCPRLS